MEIYGAAGIALEGTCLSNSCFVLQPGEDFLGLWKLSRESSFAECHYLIWPKGILVCAVKPASVMRTEVNFRWNLKHLEAK